MSDRAGFFGPRRLAEATLVVAVIGFGVFVALQIKGAEKDLRLFACSRPADHERNRIYVFMAPTFPADSDLRGLHSSSSVLFGEPDWKYKIASDGHIEAAGPHREGIPDGVWTYYWLDATKNFEVNYERGVSKGIAKCWLGTYGFWIVDRVEDADNARFDVWHANGVKAAEFQKRAGELDGVVSARYECGCRDDSWSGTYSGGIRKR